MNGSDTAMAEMAVCEKVDSMTSLTTGSMESAAARQYTMRAIEPVRASNNP